MNILLTLFLLFLVILLLFSNLKYRNKFTNYDNNNSVIVKNYIAQLLKYIFERKQLDENIPVRFDYDDDIYDTSTTKESLNNSVPVSGSNGATTTVAPAPGATTTVANNAFKFFTTNSGDDSYVTTAANSSGYDNLANGLGNNNGNSGNSGSSKFVTTNSGAGVTTTVAPNNPGATTTVADYSQCYE